MASEANVILTLSFREPSDEEAYERGELTEVMPSTSTSTMSTSKSSLTRELSPGLFASFARDYKRAVPKEKQKGTISEQAVRAKVVKRIKEAGKDRWTYSGSWDEYVKVFSDKEWGGDENGVDALAAEYSVEFYFQFGKGHSAELKDASEELRGEQPVGVIGLSCIVDDDGKESWKLSFGKGAGGEEESRHGYQLVLSYKHAVATTSAATSEMILQSRPSLCSHSSQAEGAGPYAPLCSNRSRCTPS